MRLYRTLCAGFLCLIPAATAQSTIDVGSGAPNTAVSGLFLQAFYRNGFAYLVSLPPVGNVVKLGSTGYVQEFNDAASSGAKYALIDPSLTGQTVFQMNPGLYSYYLSVGSVTAGYPTGDSASCPALTGGNSCTYQLFDKPYALFVFKTALASGGTTYSIASPFYANWAALGGVQTLGPSTSASTAFTSPAGNVSTVQSYAAGFMANITSGTLTPRLVTVTEPVYDVYIADGGYTGSLGLPTAPQTVLSNGHYRQPFEGGTIDFDPSTGTGAVLLPVKIIQLAPSPQAGTLKLNQGDTRTVSAFAYDATGNPLTGRAFTWSTTNGRVVSIAATGNTAVLTANSGGSANISVSSEGVTSSALNVLVSAPCCAVGEGAPTASLQQAFQDALTRNRITPVLPAAAPVSQIGSGYVQQLQNAANGETLLVAASQSSGSAYLLRGALLTEYQNEGGPAGKLGFPLADATAGGRQTFQVGTLAGNPVQLVTGAILTKWGLLGYETGAAGSPTGPATPFISFRATAGTAQAFANAILFALSSGALSGKSYWISGPILAAYPNASGTLGAPTDDEFGLNGIRHQDFEGGFTEYTPGDSLAQVTLLPRVPSVSASPASAPAGSVVRLALGGFADNAQIRVSLTGQPDFLVTVPTGSYVWESYLPASSPSSSVTIRAVDTQTQAAAQSSYSVLGGSLGKVSLKTVGGDTQTGFPGAILPVRVQVVLSDDSGTVIPHSAVTFTPSPGGEISDAAKFTDSNGRASAWWRLPAQQGVAVLSVASASYGVSLTARAAGSTLPNFPYIAQKSSGAPAALLASAAAAIRYFQTRGSLSSSSGLADPDSLSTYLKSTCAASPDGGQACDAYFQPPGLTDPIPNLWRLRGFAGGQLDIRTIPATQTAVRDALAAGLPVILGLSLSSNDAPAGAHFVVATGVDGAGNLTIMDPNPSLNQSSLYAYLNGFQAADGATDRATLTGAATVAAQTPASFGFLAAVNTVTSIQSASGLCGAPFVFPSGQGVFAIHYCDAAASLYQLDVDPASGQFDGLLDDLAVSKAPGSFSGAGGAPFAIDHSGSQWEIGPLAAQIAASGVGNAFDPSLGLAPGGLASIHGIGLSTSGAAPQVTVNGETAPVVSATSFEIDFQIPADVTPASDAAVNVNDDDTGSAGQSVNISPVAPAIAINAGIVNSNAVPNSRYSPARRGQAIQVIGTGFGAWADPSTLSIPLTATIGGVSVPVSQVSPLVNQPGQYQVTLALPQTLPPGLALGLQLVQGGVASNSVPVAVQ